MNGFFEGLVTGPGRGLHPAHLPHVLAGGCFNFFSGRLGLQSPKGRDVPAHAATLRGRQRVGEADEVWEGLACCSSTAPVGDHGSNWTASEDSIVAPNLYSWRHDGHRPCHGDFAVARRARCWPPNR
jgi:hypothetical protein